MIAMNLFTKHIITYVKTMKKILCEYTSIQSISNKKFGLFEHTDNKSNNKSLIYLFLSNVVTFCLSYLVRAAVLSIPSKLILTTKANTVLHSGHSRRIDQPKVAHIF